MTCDEREKWISFLPQNRGCEFIGYSDHLILKQGRMGRRSSGPDISRDRMSLASGNGERVCGAREGKMAAACEAHGAGGDQDMANWREARSSFPWLK